MKDTPEALEAMKKTIAATLRTKHPALSDDEIHTLAADEMIARLHRGELPVSVPDGVN